MMEMYIDLHGKYQLYLSDSDETWIFSRQFFEKCWNIKLHEILCSESQVVPCGQTERHDETNSRFSQIWESA